MLSAGEVLGMGSVQCLHHSHARQVQLSAAAADSGTHGTGRFHASRLGNRVRRSSSKCGHTIGVHGEGAVGEVKDPAV